MNYKVWKITAEDFVEVAQFADWDLANRFARMMGEDFEATTAEETPVW